MKFPSHIPFVEALGFELHRFEGGQAELRVDLDQAHLNSWEVAHGGVLMTMLDVTMAHAARSIHDHQPDFGPGVVTVEMKTSFMRPAEGPLRCNARLLHRSSTMAFCEGSVVRCRRPPLRTRHRRPSSTCANCRPSGVASRLRTSPARNHEHGRRNQPPDPARCRGRLREPTTDNFRLVQMPLPDARELKTARCWCATTT